ncbi:MAG: DUF692 domain-containing protein [Sphingomonas sp.]|nr:DUF692 domain-containing protein [Sphingomonas sp.]
MGLAEASAHLPGSAKPVRSSAGVSLKPEHFGEALACASDGLWFEVHAENYMVAGGPRLAMLEKVRERRPLSVHGVGLSLAGSDRPDADQLSRLCVLADRFQPFLVSEHLAWSMQGENYFPDLLPFPRTHEALRTVSRNIEITQDALGRPIAIENPSLYIAVEGHDWSEVEFLEQLVRRTGCGLLIDVNNVHVSSVNLGFDSLVYLDGIPASAVLEIHLAGHSVDPEVGASLLIDSHDAPVSDGVWQLFDHLLSRIGPRPSLIERDGNLPSFSELLAERDRAQERLERVERTPDARAA